MKRWQRPEIKPKLPDEVNKKIIVQTGNAFVHTEVERNKSVDVFYEQAKYEHK